MKMNSEIKGLTLDKRYFELAELIRFCEVQIQARKDPEWKLDVFRFILDFLSDSDSILQRTSGTTGAPKNIELPKSAMLTSAQNTIDFFHLKKDDVAVLCLPIQYIAGKMMVVRALLAGLKLHLIEPGGTPDFAGISNINFCAMVPMQATHLLEKKKWPKLKTLILGGAETGNELLQQLQTVDTEVYETYGMAETSSHVALKKINGKDREQHFTALQGVKLSSDERDCMVIETSYLPEKLITNDRVEFIAPNQFKWLGRFDNVINSGGLKIQPETLEKQFQEILEMPCAVIGVPDELLGQKMILAVESSFAKDSNQILKQLAPHFDKKMLPKQIYFVNEFPRNESFKVDRKALLKLIS
ncbi:AMP-binding protein [Maribellus sediminis]|uniref:AMP-binding protein n=1 Tax=Maribellus sediminis TaxID=2696285 RepID=UPI0014308D41|nr:AMP-binding protein [Maribellus sediminis]